MKEVYIAYGKDYEVLYVGQGNINGCRGYKIVGKVKH